MLGAFTKMRVGFRRMPLFPSITSVVPETPFPSPAIHPPRYGLPRAQIGERLYETSGCGSKGRMGTITVLQDEVLLDVFDFHLDWHHQAWHKLIHVCRRWRQLVFASPRRLNLHLYCTNRTPVKTLMDIWPALPIVVHNHHGTCPRGRDVHNIHAALEHNDRVCKITLHSVPRSFFNRSASIKEPFPALTDLLLSYNGTVVLPDSFLCGSAPRLQKLTLSGILFPGLPNLLLSAHHLVCLRLLNIPLSGFISPEAMVTYLSSLTNLKELELGFRSLQSISHQHRPPLTPIVLSSLTSLCFSGYSGYLEDFLARIDVPLLNNMNLTFFNELIFSTLLLRSLISRTEAFEEFHRAEILFSYRRVEVTLLHDGRAHNRALQLGISCQPWDCHLSALVRFCYSFLPPLPTLEHLKICEPPRERHWEGSTEDRQWLDILHLFITVKSLYLDENLAPRVAFALQGLDGEGVTELLPALQNVFVQGSVRQDIAQFIAARQLLGHPVALRDWDGKWAE